MAGKHFNLIFDVNANINPIKTTVNGLQNSLSRINIPDNFKKNLDLIFNKITKEIENFEVISSKGFSNIADVGKAEKSFNRITDLLNKLKIQTNQLKGIDPNKFLPEANLKRIRELQQSWGKLKATIGKGPGNSNEVNKQTQELIKQEKELKNLETSYNSLSVANQKMGSTKGNLTNSLKADRKEADALVAKMSELEKIKGGKSTAEYKSMAADFKLLTGRIERGQKQFDTLSGSIEKNRILMTKYQTQITATRNNIKDINNTIEQLEKIASQTPEGLDELRQKIAEIKGIDISEISTDIDQIGKEINELNAGQIQEVNEQINDLEIETNKVSETTLEASQNFQELKNSALGFDERAREMEQLANQIKQFFSIGNTVQLFKRSIKSAFDTIKELDAVMTQTAVVTKYTVANMWSQLPEYTKRANELGVSVKGAYEAATLYYQQGLETNEVIGVSNETLKMAKIAAIDYATATDYMTSALRGFNMEVNEASAQRVNDIYSELAARTAADTEEISIAMSKTAPLAHNAGMEIETTAALLSQMIETTREAPETLGTAMKTVIARFQELKKDPALIEPVEGEIVDANKIEAALRTIDVNLRDTSGQFRDLDEVFLEISSKWDSLDTNTQRYIATIAAGSRQQSRFIAMMANYNRTIDLVTMANNAAGASQEQFEKTLDSMQSKLDRLHNAWNEYTMGLANNQIIKTVIDLLTGFLNIINKISTVLSGDKGIFKSFFDIAFLIAGLKLARAAFNGFFGWLVNTGQKTGKDSGKQLAQNFSLQINQISSRTKAAVKSMAAGMKAALEEATQNGGGYKEALVQQFSGFVPEVQKEIHAAAPQIAESFINDFKNSINYDALDSAGKRSAIQYIDGFKAELQKGDFKAAVESLNNGAKEAGATFKVSEKTFLTTTQALGAMGSKISNVGSLFTQLGSILSNLGLEGLGNALSKIGTVLTSLGGAISSLIPLVTTGLGAIKVALIPLLPYLLPILAAVVAIGVAFAAWKISQLNSLENQMKAVEESTKRAKEAAEEAKDAYDQLLNDKSGYDETQQALKDLTYGTQEWKEALVEANQQVLTLLQNYPKLMQYLGKGEYGQLTISEEGWQAVIDAQQKAIIRSQGAVAQSQLQQNKLQGKVLDRDLARNFQYTAYTSEGQAYTATDTQTQQKVKDLVAGNLSDGELDAALQDLANDSRWTKEELESAVQAVIEYNNAVDQNQLEMQNAAKAFLTSALTTEHMDQVGQDVAENIVNAFSDNLVKTSEAEINSLSQEIRSNQGKRDKLASELGVVLGGNTRNQLNQLYAALSNQTLEDVKAMKLSGDRLAKEIAKYQSGEDISKKMNNFAESFTNLAEETQKQVNLAMSEGAEYISGMTEEANLDLEDSEIEAIEAVYGSLEEYAAAYAKAVENGKIEIEEVKQPLKDLNIIDDSFVTGLNAGAISGLTSHLMEVFEVSGSAAASTLADVIQTILEGMDDEQAAEFATALNSIDWSSADSIEGLNDRLEQLVKDGTMSEDEIDGLEKQIVELAKAARTVDLEKVAEQIKSLSKIQYNIGKDEQGSSFSESDYKALIDAGVASAGDFVYNLATDSWTYIGGSMEDLSQAINDNTKSLLNLDNLESGVRSSKVAASVKDFYRDMDTSNATELAKGIQRYIVQAGKDNKIVSQDWLAANTGNIEALLAKWKEILGEASAIDVRIEQLKQVKAQGQQIQLQNNTTQENAQLAIGGDQNALATLQAQTQAAGVVKDVYNELTTAIREKTGAEQEAAIQTLAEVTAVYQEAQAWGLDTEQLGFYVKQLQLAYPGMTEDAAARIALANTLLNTGLGEIINSYDSWVGLINESTGLIKTSTNEDAEAFNALKKSVNKMVGASEDLSDAFWENAKNIDAVKRAAEGDLEAVEQLQKAASKDYLMNIDFETNSSEAEAAIEEFFDWVEGIDIPQMKAGIVWDDTGSQQCINAFNQMAQQANLTAEQIQEAAKRMGFDAEVTYVRQTRKLPLYEQTETITENADGSRTIKSGTPVITGYEEVEGFFPVVKTFTSLGSGGGGVSVGNHNAGLNNAKKSSGGGGGGGGSSKEEEPWENPYDWLYNLTQKINAELRTREKLERRYQRLLKTYAGSGAELKKITDQELASLEKRKKLEEQMIELRKKELKEYLAANAALAQYASIDWELEVVTINWDKINTVTDKEQGEQIEKYIDKLEKIIDEIKSAEDIIDDIEDDIIDLKERGKDQYRDLEDRVLDALISEQQDLIDEQEKINESINKAANDLIDSIQKNIDKIRQDRKNEETETSLAEKERRLAYLRQDTTGSNALEIKKLEDELRKERQDYSDSLIDQSLNDLKEQNDAAEKQREKQIELAQSQLDWQEKTGYWVDEATKIVREGLGPEGVMSENTRLYQLLKSQEEYDTMSNASRQQWKEDLANTIHEAFIYLQNILNNNDNGQSNSRDIMAEIISQVGQGKSANEGMIKLSQLENERNAKIETEGLESEWPKTDMINQYNKGKNSYTNSDANKDWMQAIQDEMSSSDPNWSTIFYYAGKRDGKISNTNTGVYASDWTFQIVFDEWYKRTKSRVFKKGGLIDFTGPAWLDGSKSKPEMVLNAKDTENFIQLRDILSGLRTNLINSQGSKEDLYFDIDINIEKIDNDYDVDRMVDKVKQSIYNESIYRNVNVINLLK